MAIGAGLLFNIRIPANFNSPYKAVSIQDFWRRWHITLSKWLKDYVYIPLGGNRKNTGNTYLNLFLTFLIGGIWHGAGWTFVIWGALHGIAIAFHRFLKNSGVKIPVIAGWFLTFIFVHFTWIFFRADTWLDAIGIFKGLLNLSDNSKNLTIKLLENSPLVLLILFMAVIIAFFLPNSIQITKMYKYTGKISFKTSLSWAFITIFLFFVSFIVSWFGRSSASEFIYFNF